MNPVINLPASQALILIRGPSGSGKSTLARALKTARPALKRLEADMFMRDASGRYDFVPERLGLVHNRCQQQTERALRRGRSVIVSNTFVLLQEFSPYMKMADACRVPVVVFEVTGCYASVHRVPSETIARQRQRMVDVSAIAPAFPRSHVETLVLRGPAVEQCAIDHLNGVLGH